jgi:PTH2 family peptidyl-tRNA hydrolase
VPAPPSTACRARSANRSGLPKPGTGDAKVRHNRGRAQKYAPRRRVAYRHARSLRHRDDPRVVAWLAGSNAKVCVRVESEQELLAVYRAARQAGLLAEAITDAGRTEFHGVPTVTCLAVGPDTDDNLAPITGELKLL